MCCAVEGSVQAVWNLKCKVYAVEVLGLKKRRHLFLTFSIAAGRKLENVTHLSELRQ